MGRAGRAGAGFSEPHAVVRVRARLLGGRGKEPYFHCIINTRTGFGRAHRNRLDDNNITWACADRSDARLKQISRTVHVGCYVVPETGNINSISPRMSELVFQTISNYRPAAAELKGTKERGKKKTPFVCFLLRSNL